jgi:Trk K+ transport system NAD-binding subunit
MRGSTSYQQPSTIPGEAHADSVLAGARIANAAWPRGSVAVSIDRHNQLVAPTPDTELLAGDVVVIVAPSGSEPTIRALFGEVT